MKTYRVEFEVRVPIEVERKDVVEWVRFNLHETSMMNINPLSYKDMDAVNGSVVVRP